jgi:hypothetical protein
MRHQAFSSSDSLSAVGCLGSRLRDHEIEALAPGSRRRDPGTLTAFVGTPGVISHTTAPNIETIVALAEVIIKITDLVNTYVGTQMADDELSPAPGTLIVFVGL